MIFRHLTDRIAYDNHLRQYFLVWCGDEISIEAENDEQAIAEGEKMLKEFSDEVQQ